MPPTEAEWRQHLTDSQSRQTQLGEWYAQLAAELIRLRSAVDGLARETALKRAAATEAPLDGSITARHLAMTAESAEQAIEVLSIWKARPAAVAGAVGACIALAVAFGLPVTAQQTGAITAVVVAGLALVASMRGRRTTNALVAAAERRGALAGPPSSPAPTNPRTTVS